MPCPAPYAAITPFPTAPPVPASRRSHGTRSIGWVVLLVACCTLPFGCIAPATPAVTLHAPSPSGNAEALRRAAEQFYEASTLEQMQHALQAARTADAQAAIFHELAANFAGLNANTEEQFEHYYQALLDPNNDQAALHLLQLWYLGWTQDNQLRAKALMHTLAVDHPKADVRARAAHTLAQIYHDEGNLKARDASHEKVGLAVPLQLIGAWDNDQGKAFDTELPPEREVLLNKRYDGSLMSIGWRRQAPVSKKTSEYSLGSLFTPNRWAVAYGAAAIEVQQAGPYELRLRSDAPTKVWLDDQLVYAQRRVDSSLFDQIVLPITLSRGLHKLLIKSATDTGQWHLAARIASPGGATPSQLKIADAKHLSTLPVTSDQHTLVTAEQQLDARVASIANSPRRQSYLRFVWAGWLGHPGLAVQLGEQYLSASPDSLIAQHQLSTVLPRDNQGDRASDLITSLDKAVGDQLLQVRIDKARVLQKEGLTRKARELLTSARDTHPNSAAIWQQLAHHYNAQRWTEDRCKAWATVNRLRPLWLYAQRMWGDCLRDQGFAQAATETWQAALAIQPTSLSLLSRMVDGAVSREQFAHAEHYATQMTQYAPHSPWGFERLAAVYRKQRNRAAAEQALMQILQIDPDDPGAYFQLGTLAYEFDDIPSAVTHWRASLDRDPENEKLSNRLRFVAPEDRELWEQDVPDEQALDAAVAAAAQISPAPGANLIEMIDNEVSRFNSDGTTVNVVTQVLRAVNDSGRDQLLKLGLRHGGRLRVLHAYSVSPSGKRSQVSSTRNRTARFRGLEVGSTVVLQYRHDAPKFGYLAKHVARGRTFQGSSVHTISSRWTVWAPKSTRFHEWIQGDIQREESTVDQLIRVQWSAKDMPPVVPEPYMPRSDETTARMLVSTVPDWDTFLNWEKALLVDVFQDNAEVRQLAHELLDSVEGTVARVERIHRYLMEEIRYQQDYETHIAGVKPHPASVVTRRGYGDCKDKAVLFISLARVVGIDVHFAILRTRPKGPLRQEVPMQQFDHAIIYVPPQEGLPEGRFYDPTADALDVQVLRSDDPGALALVLNPKTNTHQWIPIPYQEPEKNFSDLQTKVRLDPSGKAQGTMKLTFQGAPASGIRRLARNPKRLDQALQSYIGSRHSGASVDGIQALHLKDLQTPADLSMDVTLPAYGRREGQHLRVALPTIWNSSAIFRLDKRQHPLVLGIPTTTRSEATISLPPGSAVVRLPSDATLSAPCFEVARRTRLEGQPGTEQSVLIKESFRSTCERVEPADYAEHRAVAERIAQLLLEEVVVSVPVPTQAQPQGTPAL